MKHPYAPIWAIAFAGTTLAAPLACAQPLPLTLDTALAAAERESPRLAARRYAMDAASERASRAGELPDPKLRIGIDNLPVSNKSGDAFRWDTDSMTMRRIGLMQEVPNGDKRKARERRAAAERDVESATLAGARAALRRDVAAAWFEVHYAERAKAELERLARETETQREALVAAIAGGRASAAEAFALGVTHEAVRERLIDQGRGIAKARAQLAAFVRDAADAPLGAPPDTARLPQPRERLLQEVHAHSELASYHQRVQLAQSEAALERTMKTPDWSVEVLYGQRSPNFSNMVSVMFSVDLPFAAGRRQDRDIAARLADVAQAEAGAEEARRMHEADVRAALADWDAAAARLARYDEHVLPLARDRAEATLAAYRGGAGTLAAVIEARRAETDARISRLAAEAERARAWTRLAYLFPEEARQ